MHLSLFFKIPTEKLNIYIPFAPQAIESCFISGLLHDYWVFRIPVIPTSETKCKFIYKY